MIEFIQILSDKCIPALGWTVLHSLWQFSLIAIVVKACLLAIPQSASSTKYRVALIGLFVCCLSAFFTFFWVYDGSVLTESLMKTKVIESTIFGVTEGLHIAPNISAKEYCLQFFESKLNWVVGIWIVGFVLYSLKMLLGLFYLEKLKRNYSSVKNENWLNLLETLKSKAGIEKNIRFGLSEQINGPMLLGAFKPIILLPTAIVSGLSPQMLEAIIAHELAHVVRNDYVINLMQIVVESLFYYHPMVWWLSNEIRTERENCCDDLALKISNDSLIYAKTLLHLESMQVENNTPLVLSATGNKKYLLNRIKRILNQPQKKSSEMEKLIVVCLFVLSVIGLSFSIHSDKNVEIFALENEVKNKLENDLENSLENALESDLKNSFKFRSKDKKMNLKDAKFSERLDREAALDFIENLSNEKAEFEPNSRTFNAFSSINPINNFLPKMPLIANLDSTKKEKKENIKLKINGTEEDMEFEIKNGEVKKLIINGKVIPESQYNEYEDYINERISEIPDAPAPPAPPVPPPFPSGIVPPIPPAPPTPPTPPVSPKSNNNSTGLFDEKNSEDFLLNNEMLANILRLKESATLNMDAMNSEDFFPQKEVIASILRLQADSMRNIFENEDFYQKEMQASISSDKDLKHLIKGVEKLRMDALKITDSQIIDDGEDERMRNLLEVELLKDGLINDKDSYSFDISGERLKINGKKQSHTIWEKYAKLYEEVYECKLNSKSSFRYKKNNDNLRSSRKTRG